MRSKVLQRILDKTPKEVEIFVDKYADLILRINQILREKGYTQKSLAENLDWVNEQLDQTIKEELENEKK
jgi:hypothetical protein